MKLSVRMGAKGISIDEVTRLSQLRVERPLKEVELL